MIVGKDQYLIRCQTCKKPLGWTEEAHLFGMPAQCFECLNKRLIEFPPKDAANSGQSQTVEGGDSQSSPSAPHNYHVPEGLAFD